MLEQVRTLLRRFGILSKLELKPSRATNGRNITRPYYRLRLAGPSLRVFLAEIGIAAPQKQARLIACLQDRRPNSNTEGVYAQDLLTAARDLGVPFAWITHQSGLPRHATCRPRQGPGNRGRGRRPNRTRGAWRWPSAACRDPRAHCRTLVCRSGRGVQASRRLGRPSRRRSVLHDRHAGRGGPTMAGSTTSRCPHTTASSLAACSPTTPRYGRVVRRRRPGSRLCLIVLDRKSDLADKALSVIPRDRCVWILDFAAPEIGIDPLLTRADRDAVADAIVEAFKDAPRGRLDPGLLGPLPAPGRDRVHGLGREDGQEPTLWDMYGCCCRRGRRFAARWCARSGPTRSSPAAAMFFGEQLPDQLHSARSQFVPGSTRRRNKLQKLPGSPARRDPAPPARALDRRGDQKPRRAGRLGRGRLVRRGLRARAAPVHPAHGPPRADPPAGAARGRSGRGSR